MRKLIDTIEVLLLFIEIQFALYFTNLPQLRLSELSWAVIMQMTQLFFGQIASRHGIKQIFCFFFTINCSYFLFDLFLPMSLRHRLGQSAAWLQSKSIVSLPAKGLSELVHLRTTPPAVWFQLQKAKGFHSARWPVKTFKNP